MTLTPQQQSDVDLLTPEGLAAYEEFTVDGKMAHDVSLKIAVERHGTKSLDDMMQDHAIAETRALLVAQLRKFDSLEGIVKYGYTAPEMSAKLEAAGWIYRGRLQP